MNRCSRGAPLRCFFAPRAREQRAKPLPHGRRQATNGRATGWDADLGTGPGAQMTVPRTLRGPQPAPAGAPHGAANCFKTFWSGATLFRPTFGKTFHTFCAHDSTLFRPKLFYNIFIFSQIDLGRTNTTAVRGYFCKKSLRANSTVFNFQTLFTNCAPMNQHFSVKLLALSAPMNHFFRQSFCTFGTHECTFCMQFGCTGDVRNG